MINKEFKLNDILVFKKNHPCGGNKWRVIRYGVDCKLECITCKRIVMLSRLEITKRIRNVEKEEDI